MGTVEEDADRLVAYAIGLSGNELEEMNPIHARSRQILAWAFIKTVQHEWANAAVVIGEEPVRIAKEMATKPGGGDPNRICSDIYPPMVCVVECALGKKTAVDIGSVLSDVKPLWALYYRELVRPVLDAQKTTEEKVDA